MDQLIPKGDEREKKIGFYSFLANDFLSSIKNLN